MAVRRAPATITSSRCGVSSETAFEVVDILKDADALPRWWPSVYLGVIELEAGGPDGVGRVVELLTKGWLPYTLRWRITTVEPATAAGFSIAASGDFVGTGRWTFVQEGPEVSVTYDWRIRAQKPLLRRLTWLMRPAFAANHRWAMARGEEVSSSSCCAGEVPAASPILLRPRFAEADALDQARPPLYERSGDANAAGARDPSGMLHHLPGVAGTQSPGGSCQGAHMSTQPASGVNPIPAHLRTVTPRLVVRDGDAAIDFYVRAFGAEEIGERFTDPQGAVIHAEIRIGNSIVMVSAESDDADAPAKSPMSLGGVVSAVMATYWDDVDAAWQRATAAGAEVVYPLADQFYGERGGRVRDPFGQQWMLSQHTEDVSPEEMKRRAAEFFGADT